MSRHDSSGGRPGETVAQRLSRLKRSGGNLLVVGALPTYLHAQACKSLIADGESHRRVFALAGHDRSAAENRLPSSASRDDDHLAVVETEQTTRSGAARAAPGSTPETAPGSRPDRTPADRPDYGYRTVPGDDLAAFTEAIHRSVDDLVRSGEPPEPGDLRVCVDDLLSLFSEHGRGDVVTFCHALTTRIERENGRGHFHLSLSPDDDHATALYPVFDLVVELRLDGGSLQQRWRAHDDESGWVPL